MYIQSHQNAENYSKIGLVSLEHTLKRILDDFIIL